MTSSSAEQQIYAALTQAGLNANQAAGVEGNMYYESSWNPESAAMDTNGAMSYGLISWNAASYPNAASLVTGNESADLAAQVKFLLNGTQGIQQGLSGSDAQQVASNFAQYVEVCAGCSPGGSQNQLRQQMAQQVFSDAANGNWKAGGGVSTTPGSGSTPGSSGSTPATTDSFPGGFWDPLNWPSEAGGATAQGLAGGLTGAFSTILGSILSEFGISSVKDLVIRMSLISLGLFLLLIGVVKLLANPAANVAETVESPPTSVSGALRKAS